MFLVPSQNKEPEKNQSASITPVWTGTPNEKPNKLLYWWWGAVLFAAFIFLVILPDLSQINSILLSGGMILIFLFVLEKSRSQTVTYQVTPAGIRFCRVSGGNILVPYSDITSIDMKRTPSDWIADTRTFQLNIPFLKRSKKLAQIGPAKYRLNNISDYEKAQAALKDFVAVRTVIKEFKSKK